jgi:molecular chaperone HtpG
MQKALERSRRAACASPPAHDSPACLVSDDFGMSTHLERMLKAAGQQVPASKPILEINPSHPIVERLKQETDDARFADWSHILFDQATLAEGGHLEDPASFVKRLNELMLTLAGAGPSRIWTP